jgi:putative peptide maturation dehydrogenase
VEPRVRRTVYVFFAYQDGRFLDIPQLLRGAIEFVPLRQLLALSILRGEAYPITLAELQLLAELPSDEWVDVADAGDPEAVNALTQRGLVVSTSDDPTLAEIRRRDEALAAAQWNVYAALYHSLTKWRDVDYREVLGDELAEIPVAAAGLAARHVEAFGPPPDAFHTRADAVRTHELPRPDLDSGLVDVLRRRRTTRLFDREQPLSEGELSTILQAVYGCHGYAPMAPGIVALKRTSPSGGGLHPTEAYPLVVRVDGIETGLYHYRSRDHSLELLRPLTTEKAEQLASEFTAGQAYFASAAVLIVMTGRFYRSFWKYRRHQKAYSALLMDAAHLSQTLYLVCTELGLGAFVTAAVNGANIEDALGLDGASEGSLAVCGCGRPAPGRSAFDPEFLPYVPGETEF